MDIQEEGRDLILEDIKGSVALTTLVDRVLFVERLAFDHHSYCLLIAGRDGVIRSVPLERAGIIECTTRLDFGNGPAFSGYTTLGA